MTYLETAAVLTLSMMLIKPLIQIISLPITLLTLGLFSFVINAGILFLVTKLVHGIVIYPFVLQSFSYKTVSTPPLSLNLLFACIFISFSLSVLVTLLRVITK